MAMNPMTMIILKFLFLVANCNIHIHDAGVIIYMAIGQGYLIVNEDVV
jgi:hypothetical protein